MFRTPRLWQKLFQRPLARRASEGSRNRFIPQLEILEDRLAPATTLTVTSLADSGTGTLRAAILTANGDTGDTIDFAPNLRYGTIDLTTFTNYTGNSPGNPTAGPTAFDITTSSLTIQGSGQVITRDATASAFRLFTVEAGGNLTLSGLELEGGLAKGGNGGGNATDGGGGGGAGLGGAIFNLGTLVLQNSTLTGNMAKGGSGGSGADGSGTFGGGGGGGLAANGQGGTATTSNTPGGAGGGPNSGTGGQPNGGMGGFGGGGGGGGAYFSSSTFGKGGGGGFGGGGGAGGGISGSSSGGGAGGFGGGGGAGGGSISYGAGGFGAGGGDNIYGGGGAGLGGAIFNAGGIVTITNSTITGNTAQGGNGGGDGYGGGIFDLDGTLTATNVTIANNTVTAGTGGTPKTAGGAFYGLQQTVTGITSTTETLNFTNDIFANSSGTGADLDFNGTGSITAATNLYTGGINVPLPPGFNLTSAGNLKLATTLAYNGGLTPTLFVTATSSAIGAGTVTSGIDQRGLPRSFSGKEDVGATEYTPTILIANGDTATLIAAVGASELTTIVLATGGTYTLTGVDNWWYGPDGLPAIDKTLIINGEGSTIERSSAVGTPDFRFFYVSGGLSGLPTGTLGLFNLTLKNGVAQGGNSNGGGGGLGAGGAIFNQGTVNLESSTITGNTALGGSGGVAGLGGGGGGIGQNAPNSGNGGGFGGSFPGGTGGTGGAANATFVGGSGGGGFRAGDNGSVATSDSGADGGGPFGFGGAGGAGGGHAGGNYGNDGGGGGGYTGFGSGGGNAGGSFGFGGGSGGYGAGGGGIGGGGGSGVGNNGGGGGGGFGGGGGNGYNNGGSSYGGQGGFGGGGGGGNGGGNFGGGSGAPGTNASGGGGAGFGGAVFNMFGTVTITNSTIANNTATGGTGANPGDGLGGGLFNLDGTADLLQSTIAFNIVSTDGGSIYNLTSGQNPSNVLGGPTNANLTMYNSILSNSTGGSHELVNVTGSATLTANTNAGVIATTKDLVASNISLGTRGNVNTIGFTKSNPNFLSISPANNGGLAPTLAIDNTSAAYNAGDNNAPGLASQPNDERGAGFPRINFGTVDLGAFEVQTAVTLSETGSPFSEAGGTATITATLNGTSSQPVVITLGFTGTAALGTDYSVTGDANFNPGTDQLTIPAGQTTESITLTGLNNPSFGTSSKTVIVTATSAFDTSIGSPSSVTATINPPSPTPTTWLNSVYLHLMGRPVEPGGLTYWTGVLGTLGNTVAGRTQVVVEIEAQPEPRFDEINYIYGQYLHRSAIGDAGAQYWSNLLASGSTLEQVAAQIAGSSEFISGQTDGTIGSWLNAFYQDALSRPVDASGLGYWSSVFAAGSNRAQIAEDIFTAGAPPGSPANESRMDAIDTFYMQFLGRSAKLDSGSLVWAALLQQGVPDQAVIAGILGSTEFYGDSA